jgi:hypothetical protein
MAVNLWSEAGKPTSYNPLNTGMENILTGLQVNTYQVLTFKARSIGSKQLVINNIGTINLTPEFKEYKFEFFNDDDFVRFYVNTPPTDIYVEDIYLSYKAPEVKRTKSITLNGIDGFKSGKWNLHENTVVLDNNTLVLNSTADYQVSKLKIPVSSGQTYTAQAITEGKLDGNNYPYVAFTFQGSLIGSTLNNDRSFITFTVPPNASEIECWINNRGTGKFTFKSLMLTLGTQTVPHEEKRGDVMVIPTPSKNLVAEQDITKWFMSAPTNPALSIEDTGEYYMGAKVYRVILSGTLPRIYTPMKPVNKAGVGSIYIKPINFTTGDEPVFYYRKSDFTTVYGTNIMNTIPVGEWSRVSKSAPAIPDDWIFMIYNSKNYQTYSEFLLAMPQYEEGTEPTAYEPYIPSLNPPAKRSRGASLIPKKNLFDYKTNSPVIIGSNSTLEVNNGSYLFTAETGAYAFSFKAIPVKKNTNYTYSVKQEVFEGAPLGVRYHLPSDGTYSTITGTERTFNTGNADSVVLMYYAGIPLNSGRVKVRVYDIQLEEGTTKTPHEPYELVNKPARR